MKSIIAVLCLLVILAVPGFAQDGKETLTLKRDLVQERILRIQSELELMKIQYGQGQVALGAAKKELESLNAALQGLEKKPESKPEPKK